MLWFLAERDGNVPLVSTRAALDRAFAASPGDDHEVVVIADALHSIPIPSPDGPPRFASGCFDRMGAWLAERGLSDAACWGPSARPRGSGSPPIAAVLPIGVRVGRAFLTREAVGHRA